ncbi:hypothetical protein BDQ17DRAFT_1399297 [Cyathus striatus]|nr:hypothetical protein BDQ17DRAFT_1399297 [Cyathus striatus]
MSSPILTLLSSSQAVSQGAEAKIYKGHISPNAPPLLLKHRFKKQYRHATLDSSLTRSRVAGEARALLRCLRSGVNVPGIRMVDAAEGVLGIEWIEGHSLRRLIPGVTDEDEDYEEAPEQADNTDVTAQEEDPLKEYGVSIDTLMGMIGTELAKMHKADIIHGDLTTSNMMLRHPSTVRIKSSEPNIPTELVLIDFGLSYQSALVEDKAVDLYVLERAFASTHPESEPMFAKVLEAYAKGLGKDWEPVRRRLEDVRMRGRKRSMVG